MQINFSTSDFIVEQRRINFCLFFSLSYSKSYIIVHRKNVAKLLLWNLILHWTEMSQEYIQQLPEPILLKIFHYCSYKTLGYASVVCRKWHRIAYDQSLWREADLRGLDLTMRGCLTLIDRISPNVITMNLNGCALTVAFIATVAEKCIHLRTLRWGPSLSNRVFSLSNWPGDHSTILLFIVLIYLQFCI